jgi:predicted Na+-dependent transporter
MIASGIAIGACTIVVMAYSGLLFDPALMRQQLSSRAMRALGQLAWVNFLLIPLATLGLIQLIPTVPDLNLVLLTLAIMPCAPVVPALVSMAGEPPDWPMFVFLVFSLLGILLVPVLLAVLPQPWAAGNLAQVDSVSGWQILLYLLTGYFPLLLGILLRLFDNARGLRLLKLLKPSVPLVSVVAVAAVLFDYWQVVVGMTLREVALILASILMCAALGLACGPRVRGAPMTNTLPTAFRNITMALAFCNTVFAHTKATAYLFAVSVALLLLTFAAISFQRRIGARATVG